MAGCQWRGCSTWAQPAPLRTTRAPGPESGVRPRRVRSLPVSWQSLMGRVRGSGHASVDIKDHKS